MLINMFGLPGSGKSTLRNALVDTLGVSTVGKIPGDHYLLSRLPNQSLEEYFAGDRYDWALLQTHLSLPLGTVVSTPTFDYVQFVRLNADGNKPFTLSRVNILDTSCPCPFADLKILMMVDSSTRKERIVGRKRDDLVWKQQTLAKWDEDDDRQKNKLYSQQADLVLLGTDTINELVTKVIKLIEI